jgi:tol-pal system protein YbgF
LLVAVLLGAGLPARAGLFDDDLARKQISDQSRRIDELRTDLKSQNDALNGRIGKLDDAVRGAVNTQHSMLELVNQIETLKREIQNLRGQIEVINNGLEQNAKRQRDMYVDLDNRLRRIEQGASAPTGAAPADAAPPAASGPATTPAVAAASTAASADETRAYEAAQQQRRVGNFRGAISSFQTFLTQHPKSSLAHRAQYWIGDSYFNLKDYKGAIASQQKLIATYPDSASAPDAMLNIASSQSELGEAAAARKTMDTLVARYPGSEAAEKAKRRLTATR